jgi:hypothetical protein
MGNGGGKIKHKIIVPVLVLFAVALFFNMSDVSAANNTTTTQISATSTSSGATPVAPKVTFTSSQINTASSKVKAYVETNNKLPSYVTINNTKVTMPQFLQLMTENLAALNKGSTTKLIVLKNVKCPSNYNETLTSGTLTKSEFLTVAAKITSTINSTGIAPSYVNTSLGKMRFENMVYTYSKILNFYITNKRLPNTVSVNPWSTSTSSEGSPATVAQILKTAAKYGYSHSASDAAGLIKYGSGDCWAMSDYLFKKFKAAGIKSRIVQYATAYASNHRSVQLYQNGSWVDVPYRTYGFNLMFNNTSGSKSGSVIACN